MNNPFMQGAMDIGTPLVPGHPLGNCIQPLKVHLDFISRVRVFHKGSPTDNINRGSPGNLAGFLIHHLLVFRNDLSFNNRWSFLLWRRWSLYAQRFIYLCRFRACFLYRCRPFN